VSAAAAIVRAATVERIEVLLLYGKSLTVLDGPVTVVDPVVGVVRSPAVHLAPAPVRTDCLSFQTRYNLGNFGDGWSSRCESCWLKTNAPRRG
jgi:hypothetical protein